MAKTTSKSRARRTTNNNPTGRNQYSRTGVLDLVRERPFTAAATAVGAAAAGVFLWSKRAQIGDQLNNLSDQIGEWSDDLRSEDGLIGRNFKGAAVDQSDFAEEALTLKETSKKTKRPADPMVEAQTKAGAVAY